jgi:hypothetical protein
MLARVRTCGGCDVTHVVDRVNVKPARQEWILALYQRLRDATEKEHRR